MKSRFLFGVLCTVVFWAVPLHADQIVNWADSGWYDSFGFHASENDNYITGFQSVFTSTGSPVTYNDYFVFNLSGVTGPVTAAILSLDLHACPNCGYQSSDATETYTLFDVSTSISSLESTNIGATGIFGDLGSGIALGSKTISNSDNGTIVNISLNSDAIAYINSASGGSIAFGGTVTSLNGTSPQFIFGFGGNDPGDTRQLRLNPTSTAVPESASIVLLATGLTAIGCMKRRRFLITFTASPRWWARWRGGSAAVSGYLASEFGEGTYLHGRHQGPGVKRRCLPPNA